MDLKRKKRNDTILDAHKRPYLYLNSRGIEIQTELRREKSSARNIHLKFLQYQNSLRAGFYESNEKLFARHANVNETTDNSLKKSTTNP